MWIFNPIYKSPIWAGQRISLFKGEDKATSPNYPIGESWEISALPNDTSVVAEGPDCGLSLADLISKHGTELLGAQVQRRYGNSFPLLVKLIDTDADLSIQVHPDDALAQSIGHTFGKNELWYILEARPGAHIACGFNRPIAPGDVHQLAKSGKIVDYLRYTEARAGDVFFIPAGRVHAIGAGILLAEVQQSSNDTFRLFDYNRTDKNGKLRPLHLDMAAKALLCHDTHGHPIQFVTNPQTQTQSIHTDHFTVEKLTTDHPADLDLSAVDSFVIVLAIDGDANISTAAHTLTLQKGHTALIPASEKHLHISPLSHTFTALKIYIE